jgi:hypothetical protein
MKIFYFTAEDIKTIFFSIILKARFVSAQILKYRSNLKCRQGILPQQRSLCKMSKYSFFVAYWELNTLSQHYGLTLQSPKFGTILFKRRNYSFNLNIFHLPRITSQFIKFPQSTLVSQYIHIHMYFIYFALHFLPHVSAVIEPSSWIYNSSDYT